MVDEGLVFSSVSLGSQFDLVFPPLSVPSLEKLDITLSPSPLSDSPTPDIVGNSLVSADDIYGNDPVS